MKFLPARFKRSRNFLGERSARQTGASPVSSSGGLSAFAAAPRGTYDVYRRISAHPTVAEVMSLVKAPIIRNSWSWNARAHTPPLWLDFVRDQVDPLRQQIVADNLRALEFGCWKSELIFSLRGGRIVLQNIKSLAVDEEATRVQVDPITGQFRGFTQTNPESGAGIFLPADKCLLFTYDAEPGNLHGRSRHENVRRTWHCWEQISDRLAQYLKKVSGLIVQLHYPDGVSKNSAGADAPNHVLAQEILEAVSAGKSVRFPNAYASVDDPRVAAELAGKSAWVLSTLESGTADHARGLLDALAYFDKLLFRGWLRPERVGLEAQRSGSRADSQQHSDASILDAEVIDAAFASACNRQVIDTLLALNFGEEARGGVWIDPSPIADNTQHAELQVLLELLKTGQNSAAAMGIDLPALLRDLNIPSI